MTFDNSPAWQKADEALLMFPHRLTAGSRASSSLMSSFRTCRFSADGLYARAILFLPKA
jgi:hypothetical protein